MTSPESSGDVGAVETVRTVGHGTLAAVAFTDLVRHAGVTVVADVRRFPGSRRWPHLAHDAMATWLPAAGVGYAWIPELGGRRKPSPDRTNGSWRNPQFRAYADHMATPEFAAGLERLAAAARAGAVAVMCSESVWWRCHRRLLADHLELVGGAPVEHLFHDGRRARHPVTPGAVVVAGHVRYPPPRDAVDAP